MIKFLTSVRERVTDELRYRVKLWLGAPSSPQEVKLAELIAEQEKTEYQLHVLRAAILEISKRIPEEGQEEMVQNAIQGLDSRIDVLWSTARHHQEVIENLTESRDQFWSTSLNFPSTNQKSN